MNNIFKKAIKSLLFKVPYIRNLNNQVRSQNELIKKQGRFAAGHYYSPIPDNLAIKEYVSSRDKKSNITPEIELNKDVQFSLLNEYLSFYSDLPFPEQKKSESRYFYQNGWFGYSDAIFLYCFLRKFSPKRIIEVGSGFSSAVILDTVDNFYNFKPEITFIDPFPDRLQKLLFETDSSDIRILDQPVQKVIPDILQTLESGDLLFIDSSHVMKAGSDVQFLMFEVIPYLPTGVFVHFHDVFYPFDYPTEWLKGGMFWNENYFLRSFLAYNTRWEILFFNDYLGHTFNNFISSNMPLCSKMTGGSLYLRKNN